MNICVITGASSGMGREAAKQLDKIYDKGIDEIWLISRRASRLEELSAGLDHKCRVMALDLTKEKDICELELSLNLVNPDIKMLINASGYGVCGTFMGNDVSEQAGMVRLNCEALVRLTGICLDYMKSGARIIQFASAAAFAPQPGFSVYAATKSFVLSFSKSLNTELKKKNISVTAVCPGPVKTEFFDISEKNGTSLKLKKLFMSKPENVVRKALYDSYKRRSVSVYSLSMNILRVFAKILPQDLILKAMSLIIK